jgi:tol-pal system protein YbgF
VEGNIKMNDLKNNMQGDGRYPRRITLHTLPTLLTFTLLLPFTGCILATQKDMMQLDDNLTQMRKTQADVVVKMTDLSANLESLNSQLDSNQQRMTVLSQKLEDLQADLTRRMNVLAGAVTGGGTVSANAATTTSNPSDIYRLAFNDYQAGKYDLALIGFRNFMSQYPRAELAPQAQFQIGECEFARKNYVDAAHEYDKVVQLFPKSDSAPKALYKKGIALQSAGRTAEAEEMFRRVVKEYPHSDVAKSAKDLIESN